MGKEFFNGWDLWQKMTFVLGCSIAIVFLVAWGKLLWKNRIVKKQEVVDEEKRTRIQELRKSGQLIETSRSHDIPFGVRAIQSGIQVDGIWISQSRTPITNELKSQQVSGSSAASTVRQESNRSSQLIDQSAPKSFRPYSGHLRSHPRGTHSVSSFIENIDEAQPTDSATTHKSYQPQKASYLRYGNNGGYHEESTDHFEGNLSPKKKVQAHRPRGSRRLYSEADSSAADNERNSGTSSDSDATFSNPKEAVDPYSGSSTPTLNKSNTDYFAVPLESPSRDVSNPFGTPTESYPFMSRPSAQALRESSWLDGTQSKAAYSNSQSPFVPGKLHLNKAVRKVNSGFEVLPAGTFGAPIDVKGKGIDRNERTGSDTETRQSNKLQKKGHNSLASEHRDT